MSTKSVVRITTEDTKKTYEFPGEDNPRLYSVELKITAIDHGGHLQSYGTIGAKHIHLEENTLLKAGLLPRRYNVPDEKEVPTEETPEDLILRLLEHVGVYPVE